MPDRVKESNMSTTLSAALHINPEIRSLYEISLIPPSIGPQEYFQNVMTILSRVFPVHYAALLLKESEKKDVFHLEALFGMKREDHPHQGPVGHGSMAEAIHSKKGAVIQKILQEPFYETLVKKSGYADKIKPPLLCIPLLDGENPMGVMTINALYEYRNDFTKDFHFLSILGALICPAIQRGIHKKMETKEKPQEARLKTASLEEILEERLTELLNKIDPYVESKSRTGLLADLVGLVEKILIKSAMEKMGHVQTAAAQLLGINRNTLRTKLKEFKIKTR